MIQKHYWKAGGPILIKYPGGGSGGAGLVGELGLESEGGCRIVGKKCTGGPL